MAELTWCFKTTLSDIIGDITPSLSSKNPQVKEGALKFLSRCLATATVPIQPPQVKPLAESLAALLGDSFEGARVEAATSLGTLMKMVGERPLNAIMDSIDDLRKAKVKDAYEKATVKSKVGTAAPKPSAPPPLKDGPKKKAPAKKTGVASSIDEELEEKPAAKKPPGRLAVRVFLLFSGPYTD